MLAAILHSFYDIHLLSISLGRKQMPNFYIAFRSFVTNLDEMVDHMGSSDVEV